MAWTSPSTWVSGAVLTAAQLNQQLRDNLNAIGDAWTSYAPVWSAIVTPPTPGNGSVTGGYVSLGKLVFFRARIVMGSTTTYGSGAYTLTLPVAPATGEWAFDGSIIDASGGLYPLLGVRQAGSVVDLRTDPTTAGTFMRAVTGTAPFTLATSDTMFISGLYEAA